MVNGVGHTPAVLHSWPTAGVLAHLCTARLGEIKLLTNLPSCLYQSHMQRNMPRSRTSCPKQACIIRGTKNLSYTFRICNAQPFPYSQHLALTTFSKHVSLHFPLSSKNTHRYIYIHAHVTLTLF